MNYLRIEIEQEPEIPGDRVVEAKRLEEMIALSGISPRLWRLYAVFWLVCLFFPMVYLIRTPLAPISLFVALAGLGIFVIVYFWIMWPYPLVDPWYAKFSLRSSVLLPLGITLLVLFLSLTYGSAFSWLFLGISAIIGVTLPARRAFWTVTALTLLTLGVSVVSSGGIARTDWLQIIPLVLLVRGLGLDMTGLTRLAKALGELSEARRELARQAVVEERLRVARDLHDLLGHTLSLITLKSELARRLIEKDSTQAVQEVLEIERTARRALREVRETIAGYRQGSLASELDGARQILKAAGIVCNVEQATGAFPQGIEVPLAWAVREGVTNVIRHSRAKQCLLRITRVDGYACVEVTNDGYPGPDQIVNQTGTGLSGLAERITALGGEIQAGSSSFENRPGFRLMVRIPIQNELSESTGSRDDPGIVG
jgi:two-component system sensor histidine kinase DesK